MLIPHNPSQNLHARSRDPAGRYDDVEVTVVEWRGSEEEPMGRGIASGRAAAINRRAPEP